MIGPFGGGGGGAGLWEAVPGVPGQVRPKASAGHLRALLDSGTITASAPSLSIQQRWNAAGVTFEALTIDVTEDAAASGSLFARFSLGGVQKFAVRRDGSLLIGPTIALQELNSLLLLRGGSVLGGAVGNDGLGQPAIIVNVGGFLGFNSTSVANGSSADVRLYRDASDILAQRRGTNPQTWRIYGTYTDASNYERGALAWASNILRLSAEAAGTGVARVVQVYTGSTNYFEARLGPSGVFAKGNKGELTLSDSVGAKLNYDGKYLVANSGGLNAVLNGLKFSITQGTVTTPNPLLNATATWNNGAETFIGILADFTDTASATGSLLMDLRVGGVSKFSVGKDGGPGFYGVTPVAQPAHIVDADGTLADITTKFNQHLADMALLGLQAAA